MIQRVLTAALLSSLLAVPVLAADAPTTPRANWVGGADSWSSGTYEYDGAGNIKQIGNDIYRYDAFGRLVQATARTAGNQTPVNTQTFAYDSYGNLERLTTQTTAGTMVTAFAVNEQTNQLNGQCEAPFDRCLDGEYDSAGNQIGRVNPGEYTWDPLGVMSELHVDRPERYVYDANDERILTINTEFAEERHRYTLRGADNKVLRELTHLPSTDTWGLAKDYVYRGGTLVASFSGTETQPSRHYHIDHLGSTRLVTDGNAVRLATHTYWPFGQETAGSESDTERMKFTGHERDGEGHPSGFELDYMHARYYDANQGRFLSVDPVLQVKRAMKNPQMWNRYAYAVNNPLKYIDPTGKVLELPSNCADQKTTCKELSNIRNTVPVELRMFVRTRTVDGKTVLDTRFLSMKSGAASGNFQALRQIANSPGVATFNSSMTNVQSKLGSEAIGRGQFAAGITYMASQSLSGKIEVYAGGDLGAVETAETTAHELRHARRALLGLQPQHEMMSTFSDNTLTISHDPNGPVNIETKSAEREAAENYDPFVPPNE